LTGVDLPGDDELGGLGVAHLVRMWARADAARRGDAPAWSAHDAACDTIVLDGLGLGREPTLATLWRAAPTLADFESAILAARGGILDPARVGRVNALVLGLPYDSATTGLLARVESAPAVFDADDLRQWHDNGYVVLHDAASAEDCQRAERAVWEFLGASPDDPSSWYPTRLNRTMVQLFYDPALEAIRSSDRIHKAFAQLWGTADLLGTTDRCGFNPPETSTWSFPGPNLHWDIALESPLERNTQGVLYLTDTKNDQGAFSCVAGFHHTIEQWLACDPRRREQNPPDPGSFVATPIPGRAGDLIIWNDTLPHGSSPNRAERPRIVHYVKMSPPFPRTRMTA
jgi:hypothetical protein